jgi:hypothetical protein
MISGRLPTARIGASAALRRAGMGQAMSAKQGEHAKAVCVVLDTNIWVREALLRSALGDALLHALKRINGRIGLPEAVEAEAPKIMVTRCLTEASRVRTGLSFIRALVADVPDFDLPSEATLRAAVKGHFRQLGDVLLRVRLTARHARAALARVVDKTPPNPQNGEEFRDCLIWEAVLELGRSYHVWFVTEDGHFYLGGRSPGELAPSLLDECEARGVKVTAFRTLRGCLTSLEEQEPFVEPAPDLDHERIARLIHEALAGDPMTWYWFLGHAARTPGELKKHTIQTFPTDDSNVFAVSFELQYEVFDVPHDYFRSSPEEDRRHPTATLIVEGACSLNTRTWTIANIRLAQTRGKAPSGEDIPRLFSLYATLDAGGRETSGMQIPWGVR